MAQYLTQDTFESYVSGGLSIVDFYAEWCPPCQKFMLVIPRLEQAIGDIAKVGKVDVDEQDSLAQAFNITHIPTFIIFKDGIEVDRWSGIKTVVEIENRLRSL